MDIPHRTKVVLHCFGRSTNLSHIWPTSVPFVRWPGHITTTNNEQHMKPLLILLTALTLTSCAKDDAEPAAPSGTGGPSGGFTVPTTSYWKINGTNNSGSAEIVSVNVLGNEMGLNKPFPDLGFGYCQLRVFFDDYTLDIRNQVPEGGYLAYPITINSGAGSDSIRVQLDVQDQNSSTSGYYFYRATGGKVYISKTNGLLRFTSDAALPMSGVKAPAMQDYIYSCQLEFSQVQP